MTEEALVRWFGAATVLLAVIMAAAPIAGYVLLRRAAGLRPRPLQVAAVAGGIQAAGAATIGAFVSVAQDLLAGANVVSRFAGMWVAQFLAFGLLAFAIWYFAFSGYARYLARKAQSSDEPQSVQQAHRAERRTVD